MKTTLQRAGGFLAGMMVPNIPAFMAADPLAVPLLVGLGIGTLSVAPSAVAAIKQAVRGLSRTETQGLVDEVVALATAAEVALRLRQFAVDEGRSRVHADRRHH